MIQYRWQRCLLLGMLLACLCQSTAHPLAAQEQTTATATTVEVGDKAPDFSLPSQDGEFQLSDHLGHNVVVVFVRAHW
jgi:hypothetical protein